jgi:hypothetical protein
MPRPIYVLCARGVSEDKTSNIVSILSIIETVEFAQIGDFAPAGPLQIPMLGPPETLEISVLSVWMGLDQDAGLAFEHQWHVSAPGVPPAIGEVSPFQFENERRLSRFHMRLRGLPIPPASCLIEFESRIRAAGQPEWTWRQSYPIVCTVHVPNQPA